MIDRFLAAWLSFSGVDGAKLAYASFQPPTGAPMRSGVVVRVNGRGTTFLQDDELIAELTASGHEVFAYDHRGQGLSGRLLKDEPEVGHVESFDDYVADLGTFLKEVVARKTGGKPVRIVATSTGALVTLLALTSGAQGFERVERVVLNVPLIRIHLGPFPPWLARLLIAPFGPTEPVLFREPRYVRPPFEGNDVTSDPARFARFHDVYARRPETRLGPPSNHWVREALDAADRLAARIDGATLPKTLVIQATADTIVDPAAQAELCRKIADCELYRAEGARHGAIIERDEIRSGVVAKILAFLGS